MLVHRNIYGDIILLADYEIVDKEGKPNNNGLYCFVRYTNIDKSLRKANSFKEFVMKEHLKYPTVKWIYYQRENRGDSRIRMFEIKKLYKKIRKEGNNE